MTDFEPLEITREEYSLFFQWCSTIRNPWPHTKDGVRQRLDDITWLPNVSARHYPNAASPDRLREVTKALGLRSHKADAFAAETSLPLFELQSTRGAVPPAGPTGRPSKSPLFVGDLPPMKKVLDALRRGVEGTGYAFVKTERGVRIERGTSFPEPPLL